MKKILIWIFACITLVGYMLSYEMVGNVYDTSLSLSPQQVDHTVAFHIFSNAFSKQNEANIAQTILTLCKENKVSLIKTSPKDESHVNEYVYLTKNIYTAAGLHLSHNQINKLNQNKDFLLTNDIHQKADEYFPYFDSQQKYYIYNYRNYDFIDGSYLLIGKHADHVYRLLKDTFPSLSLDNGSSEQIAIDKNIMRLPRMQSFAQLAVILLIISIVCMLMYFSQIYEQLAIKKMFGFSSLKLLIRGNRKLFLEIVTVSVSVDIICMLLTVREYNIFVLLLIKYLIFFFSIQLLMMFIIFLFLFYFLKHVKIAQVLKHNADFKTLFILHMILRITIVIFGISIIGEYLKPMISDIKNVSSYAAYTHKTSDYYKADNMQQLEEDTTGYLEVLYDQVNRAGGIGIEMSSCQNFETGEELQFYSVNTNYVNHENIKDVKGNRIKLKKNEYFIFTSDANMGNVKQIMKAIPEYSENWSIKKIAPHQKIFTFDNLVNEEGLGYAKDPIIIISDYLNPWSVYLTKDQIHKDAFDQALRDKGYKATFDMYPVRDTSTLLYESWLRVMWQDIVLVTVSFLAICAVIAQYVLAYMESFKKSIAIKKSMGYSLIKRYDRMIMIMSFFYFAVSSYCLIWNRPLIEQSTVLVMFLFECLLSVLLILKNERKLTAESLKE